MEIIQRLLNFFDHINEKGPSIREKLNIKPSNWSQIKSGKNNLTVDHILKISKVYPQLNTNWLLKGEGEMLIETLPLMVEEPQSTYIAKIGKPVITDIVELSKMVYILREKVESLENKSIVQKNELN